MIQQRDFSGAELMHIPVMEADRDPLLACPPGSPTAELAERHGIATAPLPFRSLRYSGGPLETLRSAVRGVRSAIDLRRLLRAHPDRRIVYCTALRPGMLAALAAVGLGRRIVWHVPSFIPPPPVGWVTRMLAWQSCDIAIAHSAAVETDFVRRSGRLRARTVRCHPGTGIPPEPAPRAHSARAAIVGSVTKNKRVDLAVEVAGLVGAHAPAFELDVVGRAQFRADDLEFERELHARVAADPALRPHVVFGGYATDVQARLAGCALLLHCCEREPFGIALIEAMALGLPVVAPATAGPSEIVEPGRTGLLYPPGDAAAAAAQVLTLLEDDALRARMGDAGRAAVIERFSIERQVAAIDNALAGIVAGG